MTANAGLPPFSPGKAWEPSAAFLNDVWNAVLWVRQQSAKTGSASIGSGMGTGIIRVINKTGGIVDPQQIVGLGAAQITDPSDNEDKTEAFQRAIVLDAEVLEVPKHFDRWAVMLEGLEDSEDAVGRAMISGAAAVRVWNRSSAHRWAEIMNLDFPEDPGEGDEPLGVRLSSSIDGSVKILWMEEDRYDDEGEKVEADDEGSFAPGWSWAYAVFPYKMQDVLEAVSDRDDEDHTIGVAFLDQTGGEVDYVGGEPIDEDDEDSLKIARAAVFYDKALDYPDEDEAE